jgi:hypothetical protein
MAVTVPGQFLVPSLFLYFYLSSMVLSLLVSNSYLLAAAPFLKR